MIFLPDKHVAIITPPHTASRNVHYGLGSDGYWVLGEDPFIKGSVDHHSAKIHDAWGRIAAVDGKEFKTYLVCRNPYTRLVGLFLHYEWAQERGLGKQYLCWEEFVYNKESLNWMFNKTISDFVEASGLTDFHLIRYENLEDELSAVAGENIILPERYHDPIILREWYYDSKLLLHINETWAESDCKAFGYDIIEKI